MYKRILIVNRGICACSLIEVCHRMGIEAWVCVSEMEQGQLFCRNADGYVVTGAGVDAYRNVENILESLERFEIEAVLPGYGFLSEDAVFALRCRLMSRDFVGPQTRFLSLFGDKLESKRFMASHSFRVLEGVKVIGEIEESLGSIFEAYGGRVMLKGRYGGGGRGVELWEDCQGLKRRCRRLIEEGRGEDYFLESCVSGRHIEFQMAGDRYGVGRCLGVRDCSIQRNFQKIMEFSEDLGGYVEGKAIAEKLALLWGEMGYCGLGSVEFMVDDKGCFYFMEVNPRLQVEHGVTEMESGIDMVGLMLRLSLGWEMREALAFSRVREARGSRVVEFRLYLGEEEVVMPDFGSISGSCYDYPLRVELGHDPGEEISVVFDRMIGKVLIAVDDVGADP